MQFIVVRVEWRIRFLHTIILASMKFSIVFTEWKILFNPPDLLIVHMYIVNVNFVLELKACSIVGERAKRARHYQGCTNSSWCGIYIYIYICMEVRMP